MRASKIYIPAIDTLRDTIWVLMLGLNLVCSQLLMLHLLLSGMPDAEMSTSSHYASTIASVAVLVALQQNAWVHMAVPFLLCLPDLTCQRDL